MDIADYYLSILFSWWGYRGARDIFGGAKAPASPQPPPPGAAYVFYVFSAHLGDSKSNLLDITCDNSKVH